jgi:PTS system fructose-specific IIC component
MLFNCTLMAPHGGIFVFAVVGNWPMYVLALAVGAVVAGLLLAVLKKPLSKEQQDAGASMDGLKLE